MTITLFSKKDFRGDSINVSADVPNVKTTALDGAPSSMRLTTGNDKVLLFKNKDFRRGCIFRQGPANISSLGNAKKGGKVGFLNSVTSVRVTPFSADVHATFIQNAAGALPGILTNQQEANTLAENVVSRASDIWSPFLLELNLQSVAFKTDDKHFDVERDRLVRFPRAFYEKGVVNVFFINSFRRALGVTRPPCLGETVAIALTVPQGILSNAFLGVILAHEFGHHIGIHHPSGRKDPKNVMNKDLPDPVTDKRELNEDQASDAHMCLARNPARRDQRRG